MKKTSLALVALLLAFYFVSKAQNTFPSSGAAGIGTTSPGSLLHLYDSAPVIRLSPSGYGGTNYATYLGSLNTAVGVLQLGNNDQNDIIAGNTATGGFLRFIVNNSNTFPSAANGTVAMTIKADGNVGIGTTSPTAANLVVYGNQGIAIDGNNAASQLNFYNSGNVLGSIGKGNYAVTSADQTGISMYSEGAMSFAAGGQSEKMRIASNGKVGIGTTSPSDNLTIKFPDAGNSGGISIKDTYLAARLYDATGGNDTGELDLLYNNTRNVLMTANGDSYLNGGKVGIGTTTPDQLLSVNGTIHSKELKLDVVNLPDYVFKPTYSLPKLADVKAYIDKHQHLPEVPSAQEVEEKGLNLGEMNKLLLKKVEELTLYLIDIKSENAIIKKKLNKLSKPATHHHAY